MTPSEQEQEDLIERLSWHDDDVVMTRTLLGGQQENWPRKWLSGLEAQSIENGMQMSEKHGCTFDVLMPFMSKDGIMFSVKK